MAGFLSEYDEIVTLKFGANDEWWCRVKRYLPRGDFRAAQQVLVAPVMRVTSKGDDQEERSAETAGEVDSGGYQNELVVRGLVDWNFTDRDGVMLPLTPEPARRASVDALPQEVFGRIADVIENSSPKKAKAEDAAFRGPSEEGAVGEAAGADGAA